MLLWPTSMLEDFLGEKKIVFFRWSGNKTKFFQKTWMFFVSPDAIVSWRFTGLYSSPLTTSRETVPAGTPTRKEPSA